MPNTVSHKRLINAARAEVRKLQRPLNIQPSHWLMIQQLLLVLCGYLPDVYPGVRALAPKLGVSFSAAHRWVQAAKKHHLIETYERPLPNGQTSGTYYRLSFLSEHLRAQVAAARLTRRPVPQVGLVASPTSGTEGKSSSSKKTETRTGSALRADRGGGCAADVPSAEELPMVNKFDPDADYSPPIGGDRGAVPAGATVSAITPEGRLARHFDQEWKQARRKNRSLPVRTALNRTAQITYLKGVMLKQVSPAYAEAYIDAFMAAAVADEVDFREGQFAWERFTAWWGRTEVRDPAETRADRDLMAQVRAAMADGTAKRLTLD